MKAQELQKIVDDTRYARNSLNAGYCIGQVSEDLSVSPATILSWLEKSSEPLNSHETLTKSHFFRAVIPVYVFHPASTRVIQSEPEFKGSGVLLNINSRLFLVTADHVARSGLGFDIAIRMNDGGLYTLNNGGLCLIRDHYPGTPRDTIDIAAFDLTDMKQSPLSKFVTPINPQDIDLNEGNIDGQV